MLHAGSSSRVSVGETPVLPVSAEPGLLGYLALDFEERGETEAFSQVFIVNIVNHEICL